MNEANINDKRKQKEFSGISFSQYKKGEAKKQLLKCMSSGSHEEACYWSAEFICAGHFAELWEIIILFMSKNIHLGNPKLPLYIELRYENFKDIVHKGYIDNELKMRNNQSVRKLFAEIICVLCNSRKRNPLSPVKINIKDFNLQNLTGKLKAETLDYGKNVFKTKDPKDLFIAINEFMYNISHKVQNLTEAFWWLEWVIAYEATCKKDKKNALFAARRDNIPVSSNFQTDIIWIIWDGILHESINRKKGVMKLVKSLLSNFCIRYSPGVKRRRKFLIYFAISMLLLPSDLSINIIENEIVIEKIKDRINIVYKQIKKNEIQPKTGYLFNNVDSGNLEKTVEKLEILNKLNSFIPRKN
jgi:hypothetical protein